MGEVAGAPRQYVELSTDHPAIALLCSQKAGWELAFDSGFEGLGSGPARALVGQEAEFERVGYYDSSEFATLTVESTTLPTEEVAEHVADLAEVEAEGVPAGLRDRLHRGLGRDCGSRRGARRLPPA